MTSKHFILATAGHVDHGKSALVKALTGTDPDRLPEEKARGITIDLGFAYLELHAQEPQPALFHVGIVDVPGHEDFVKNMVAGVGSADLALLVVAADDGWMPQTEEHLQILHYLGVTRAVVALTKIDLAGIDEAAALGAVGEALSGTPFADAPVVPTSVLSGRGLAELKAALSGVLARAPLPRDFGKPRLPIDRAFTLRGIGTVVTGTLSGGAFHRGQAVIVQPNGQLTRIRTLQSHNRELDSVGPGMRVALSLVDVAVISQGAGIQNAGIGRGQVVTLPSLGAAANTLDVVLEKSTRLAGSKAPGARPLKDGHRVRIHHGSGNFAARLLLLGQKELLPGERALAQLRLEAPVFAFAGDHFIIRDWAEQATLAGGIILDPDASRESFRSPAQRTLLQRRAEAPGSTVAALETQLQRDRIIRGSALLVKGNLSAADVTGAIAELRSAGKLVTVGDLVADTTWWNLLRQRAIGLVEDWHRARPELAGLPLNQLRSTLESDLGLPEAFEFLVADLVRAGYVQVGSAIRRGTHRPALPPQLQAAGGKLRTALAAKPFEPPSRKELAPDMATQQALRFLIQTGEAVEVGSDVVLLADSFAKAVESVQRHLCERGSATVSELRQAIGASRRIVVPLLEKLDRDGITRREGDSRVLKTRVS